MSNAVLVRAAREHDKGVVLALLAGAGLPLGGVAEGFPAGYMVALEGERVVGVAGVERYGRWGLLRSVAVAPGLRSAGLGARLVGDVLAGAAADGLDEIYLLTTTAPAFFRKLGFREVDRAGVPAPVQASAEFASICPASAVCMALPLGGRSRPVGTLGRRSRSGPALGRREFFSKGRHAPRGSRLESGRPPRTPYASPPCERPCA